MERSACAASRAQQPWLDLHACTLHIGAAVQRRLRARFGISGARFDLMVELHRQRGGLNMKTLARRLMATGANVTGLTDDLEREGLVVRETGPTDRRVRIVRLTVAGRRSFDRMAREQGQWVLEQFCGLDAEAIDQLHDRLAVPRTKLPRSNESTNQGPPWHKPRTASTPPSWPQTAGPHRATGPRTSSGRSPSVSRPSR